MKAFLLRLPVLGPALRRVTRFIGLGEKEFKGSEDYWSDRYNSGGNSGDGSYNELAEFKAEVLNSFVAENGVQTVIEYGCGDGNQLSLSSYPNYLGFDVSPKALELCRARYSGDTSKQFLSVDEYVDQQADLTLSLDVIYHLVEDGVFEDYIARLFASSNKHVIVYSSDKEDPSTTAPHVRHRKFTDWVAENLPEWRLVRHLPNRHQLNPETGRGSFADFYFFSKG